MDGRDPPDQVFKLTDVTRPTIDFEPVNGGRQELPARQSFALDGIYEMAHQIGNVVGALAQRRQPDRHHVEPEE